MSRITEAFKAAAKNGGKAFIPYMTAGYPDNDTFLKVLDAFGRAGADIIEIGLPFSDPMADGPVIQTSSTRALAEGVTPDSVFGLVEQAANRVNRPIVLMTYYNPVLKYGLPEFAKRLKACGGDGVIIPDLPVEEADDWMRAAEDAGVDAIFMAAPTTTPDRLKLAVENSRGFIYYVPILGVTGSSLGLSDELSARIAEIKARSDLPVAVGFGVSTPEQAREMSRASDGVIVGSALVKAIQEHRDAEEQVKAVLDLAGSIKTALYSSNGNSSPA